VSDVYVGMCFGINLTAYIYTIIQHYTYNYNTRHSSLSLTLGEPVYTP